MSIYYCSQSHVVVHLEPSNHPYAAIESETLIEFQKKSYHVTKTTYLIVTTKVDIAVSVNTVISTIRRRSCGLNILTVPIATVPCPITGRTKVHCILERSLGE
jgi:hypothetical protein